MADISFTMVEHLQVTSTKHLSFTFLSFQFFGQRNLLITGNIWLRMLSLFYQYKNYSLETMVVLILVIFKHRIFCLLFIYELLLFSLIP